MADLTTLEEKLAEVTGRAGAAQETTKKVESLLDDDSRAERRCIVAAEERDGKKTAILEKESAGEDPNG
jgi:hypothetical protein